MTDQDTIPPMLDAAANRRAERRRFLQLAGGASVAAGGLALLSACGGDDDSPTPTPSPTPSPTPTPTSTSNADRAALNYALQLEYLHAQYFAYATTGTGVPDALLTGTETRGTVTGGASVPFSDTVIAAGAREIAIDAQQRLAYIRGLIAAEAVAQPAINISGASDGAFTAAARAAGVVGAGETFDPYASERNFLLGAFVLQDVIVTAYKALVPLTNLSTTRTAFIGSVAAHGHYAGFIRTSLYGNSAWHVPARQFSDWRDSLDGASDQDQGVAATDGAANITPADGNGIAYSRASGGVLNILYINKASVSAGGFFPAGLNGDLKVSTAN